MTAELQSAVHHQLIASLLKSGRIPETRDLAAKLGVSLEAVVGALEGLADRHGVVLHPHICEPWILHPFSISPSATWVESGDHGWWASCMWCACGVATLAGGNATIHGRIGGEHEDIDIHIEDGVVRENDLFVHFAVPPRAAWDNVHHFCATVLPFRHPDQAKAWSERHALPFGSVVPISQVMELGRAWYSAYAASDWRKWSVREAAEIFRSVGLTDAFWTIPISDAGF